MMMVMATGLLMIGAAYVMNVSKKKGAVPEVLSDIYYMTESRLFPALLTAFGLCMLPVMMDRGVDCLGFIACAGIMMVGMAPAYMSEDERMIHKAAAVTAAVTGTAWALTVAWEPTAACAALMFLTLALWRRHTWIAAESLGIINVYVTTLISF